MSEDNVDELRKYAMDDKELNKMVDKLEKLREDPEFISIISEDHINKLAKAEGIDEKLKETNEMEWVQAMNNIKNRAEETVLSELIYW